jgi:hypothetical protein
MSRHLTLTLVLMLTSFMSLGVPTAADAGTINLSMNPAAWDRYPYWIGTSNINSSPATIVATAAGHLRGTKTTATGGSNWILGLETIGTYDFQHATLEYQWLVNGQGTYSGIYSGVHGLVYNVDPNPPSFGGLTTGWSFSGSEVIPSNQWLYTQLVFSETGYQFAVSKTGFGNTDYLHGSFAYGPTTWAALAHARVFFQFGDNYAPGAYFEVAEATLHTPAATVPDPGSSLLLLGMSLAGLRAWKKRLG